MIGAVRGELLAVEEARARVLAAVRPVASEDVLIADALGRVLAEDVRAAADVPAFANSAMDGYAVHAGPAGRRLAIVDESRAGAPAATALPDGAAMRISTGAALPDGADAVVRIEDADEKGGDVVLHAAAPAGGNVRQPGEDVRAGDLVLAAGTRVGPAELGALVVAGRATAACARRPRVALLATGDELVAPGEPLGPGQVHDANFLTLDALARRGGAEVRGAPPVPDRAAETRAALEVALAAGDVVVVSGGVSVGRHDHVKDALRELGVRERFWGLALKPGKPAWFGTREETLVFGLPGNPVSAMVTFALLVSPALRALQGDRGDGELGSATLAVPVARDPRREQAIRVRVHAEGAARVATPTGPQGSHLVTSMVGADALALVPAGEGELPAGAEVALASLG